MIRVCVHCTLTLLIFLGGFGCSSINQKLDANVFYKRDVQFEFGKTKAVGVVVLPQQDEYKIKIRSQGKIDLLTVTSCNSEFVAEKPGKSGFLEDGEYYEYTYKPLKNSAEKPCPLDIGIYEVMQGRHAWGFIDFQSSRFSLYFDTGCNGVPDKVVGVGICQSKAGLYQSLVFSEPVKSSASPNCPLLTSTDNLHFDFILPKGECVYYFGTKDGKFAKLTTIGYEAVPLRGVTK